MHDRTRPKQDKPSKPGKSRSDTTKITVALVGLVFAGLLLAWNFGLFGTAKPKDDRTPDQLQEMEKGYEEQEKLRQEMEQDPTIEIGSLNPTRPIVVRST